jgi:multimeric flavodoxin WrbA
MKVLLLRANPRKTGYTQRLTDLFVQGARETGAAVRDVDLSSKVIHGCLGCYHCWLVTPGQCVHTDDMSEILEQVLEAEVVVCSTPLYFYSMSALLKQCFERTLPLTKPGFEPTRQGMLRNGQRYESRWQGKKLITIVVGALRDPRAFDAVNHTFRVLADGLDYELAGQLTRPESYLLDYKLSKPMTIKMIEIAFVQAGREAGSSGRLTARTMEAASLPLAADAAHFHAYSNLYWDTVTRLGAAAIDPGTVQAHVEVDVRILMREMARCFNPRAAGRLKAVVQFDFTGQDLHFILAIDRGTCKLQESTVARPDLRVTVSAADWGQLFTQQVEVRELLKAGRILLEGDKSLFVRLGRYFPPPAA